MNYAGDDYFLRGTELNGNPSPPCITVPCNDNQIDEVLAKVYRFTSILSWYHQGYVDVSGYMSGSHPILYGDQRRAYSELGIFGDKSFNCNHMPIIEQDNVRKALAFWREGMRLIRVHDSYSFLSFYKVIESQFSKAALKVAWIEENINQLTDRAAKRVLELQADGIDVSAHLFDSCQCAVAHASLKGEIIDPDIPVDRRRIYFDLDIMQQLATRYILNELKVPNESTLYQSRNRLDPWKTLLLRETLDELINAGEPDAITDLNGLVVSIGLWPDGGISGLENMTLRVEAVKKGIVRISLVNQRMTVLLMFYLDFPNGRVHTGLEEGGLCNDVNQVVEADVKAYATFLYYVLGNGIAELACGELEPIDCEVVIPLNIIPPNPEMAIEDTIKQFRDSQAGNKL